MEQWNNKEVLTYKRNAGSQQQDSDKQVFELLHNQFPDALTCKKSEEESHIAGGQLNADTKVEMEIIAYFFSENKRFKLSCQKTVIRP